jgi:hypothetical protein
MMARISSALVVLLPLALAACSSSSNGGGAGSANATDVSKSSTFSAFCTGTLKSDQKLMLDKGGAWIGDGSHHVPAGTTFLVSPDFDLWAGYVILDDGSAAKIDADFTKGLVKDTDFTSSCATDPASTQTTFVVLAKSTLRASKDLTGASCTLEAGSALADYSYESGDVNTVGGNSVQGKCGFSPGYTKDLSGADLLKK